MFTNKLLLLLSVLLTINCDSKLIFVETHFRNGAKAPLLRQKEQTDYFNEEWDYPGELTGSGERMQYLLGFRNRLRYVTDTYHFLSEKYDAHEILMLSTASNYTLVSASAQLQGLYPMDNGLGDYLTEEQEKYAVPGVSIDDPDIKKEIEKLDNCSLPNSMTVIPVHMIHYLEKRMLLYDIAGCSEKVKENKKINLEKISELQTQVDDFNKEYGKALNNFYGYDKDNSYDFEWINDFCENYIADFTDDRQFEEFQSTKINLNDMEKQCSKIRENNLKYYFFGDKNGDISTLEASKIMGEMVGYMKKRVDADIKGEKIEEKYDDFSRPKMVMISSEGTTLSAHQLFLIKTFGLEKEKYRHPEYADQLTYEITRENDKEKKERNYEDYNVTFYFNDEVILNRNFQDFSDKINENVWNDEKINDFCEIKEEDKKEGESGMSLLMIIIIGWSALVLILFIVAIILCCKVSKKKQSLKEEIEGLTGD